jgi:DNA helicase MCM9
MHLDTKTPEQSNEQSIDSKKLTFSPKQMQAYIYFVRRLEPSLTPASNMVLTKYYQLQRRTDGNQSARTTIRMLESLIR